MHQQLPSGTGGRDRAVVLLRVAALSVAEMRRALAVPGAPSDRLVRNAITYAAGPELLEAAGSSVSSGKGVRARDAVHRYITRMGGRATPYGLMAGTCVVDLGDRTTLRLAGRPGYRANAFLDIALLEAIVEEHISALPALRVPIRVNPTLMRAGDYYCCRKPDLPLDVVRVRATPAVSLALSCCESPGTGEMLAERLRCHLKTTDTAKIEAFVAELVDQGLLTPDTGLLSHGRTPAEVAAGLLARTGGRELAGKVTMAAAATEPKQILTAGYLASLNRSWDELRPHSGRLREAKPGERYNLQLSVTCGGVLDRTVVLDLERAADRLVQVLPPPARLADLRARFECRYEDAAVPLLEVADPERGLLPWAARSRSAIADRAETGAEQNSRRPEVGRIQLAAFDHWLSTGEPFDLAAAPDAGLAAGAGAPAAASGKAMGALAALIRDPGQRYHSVLYSAGLTGAGALFGRLAFSHPELAERIRIEAQDGDPHPGDPGLTAEVLYSPGGWKGNVLIRASACREAIALSGATGGTIHPGRLVMRLEGSGFAVFDETSGARVRLVVNSAYGASLAWNDPLYTLLATLAESNSGVAWRWQALDRLRHLPRVTCGRVIVTPERWLVRQEDLLACSQAANPARTLRSFLPGIGQRNWIGGHEPGSDKVLPVDLGDTGEFTSNLHYLMKRKIGEFIELPHVEHPYVKGPRGRHVAEIGVSFSRRRHAGRSDGRVGLSDGRVGLSDGRVGLSDGAAVVADTRAVSRPVAREDWSYLQLFCGVSSADLVITRAHALAKDLRSGGLARQWFFIRYGDDGYHVRVRVRASALGDFATVTAALHDLASELRRDGLVTFTRQEPYVPEVRRYGGPDAIATAECLFCVDSDSVADRIRSEPTEVQRLAIATRTIAAWWRQAGCPSPELYPAMRAAQRFLWPGGRWPSKGVGQVWRANQAEVAKEMQASGSFPHGAAEISALLSQASNGKTLDGRAWEIVGSVVHMHCNRLFACDNRRMEALAYEFALREMMRVDATSR